MCWKASYPYRSIVHNLFSSTQHASSSRFACCSPSSRVAPLLCPGHLGWWPLVAEDEHGGGNERGIGEVVPPVLGSVLRDGVWRHGTIHPTVSGDPEEQQYGRLLHTRLLGATHRQHPPHLLLVSKGRGCGQACRNNCFCWAICCLRSNCNKRYYYHFKIISCHLCNDNIVAQ